MSKGNVLIVTDDITEAMAIKNILRGNDYSVAGLVIDLVDAIQQAVALKPNLIIMKIGMSGSMEILNAASRIIANTKLPILFIIGDKDTEVVNKVKSLHNSGFIFKPYNDEALLRAIGTSLLKHTAQKKFDQNKASANIDPIATHLMSIPAPALTVSKRGAITRVNKDLEFLIGYSEKELIGRKFISFIDELKPKDESEGLFADDLLPPQDDEEEVVVFPDKVLLKKADGTKQHVTILSGFVKSYGNNSEDQIYVIKKQRGEIQYETKDIDIIFTKVLNSLEDLVFVLNPEMEVTQYNNKFIAFAKRIGISDYQLTRPIYEIPQFSKIASMDFYTELFKTTAEMKQIRRYGSEKESVYMFFRFIPLVENGKVTHLITVMRDITEIEESRQKSALIYEEFMNNRSLMKTIQTGIGDLRTALYSIVKFIEKNPDKVKDPTFKQVALLSRAAEKKLLVFDRIWAKYELQLNAAQMNAKYKFDKK